MTKKILTLLLTLATTQSLMATHYRFETPKEELEEKTSISSKSVKEKEKEIWKTFDKLIPTYFDRIEKNRGEDVIFFLGGTGSGKSTTINVLLGNKIIKANIVDEPTDDDDDTNSLISENDEEEGSLNEEEQKKGDREDKSQVSSGQQFLRLAPQQKGPKIGEKTGGSETVYPATYFDRTHNLYYGDCPGTEDSKGKAYDICAALSIKKLSSPPKRSGPSSWSSPPLTSTLSKVNHSKSWSAP